MLLQAGPTVATIFVRDSLIVGLDMAILALTGSRPQIEDIRMQGPDDEQLTPANAMTHE